MRLRTQQREVDSLKGYSKREIVEIKEQMQRSYDEQLKRITEMVQLLAPLILLYFMCAMILNFQFIIM